MKTILLILAALLLSGLPLAGSSRHQTTRKTTYDLPAPCTRGGMALNEALARRRSARAFSMQALSDAQLAQLCWAAQGVTDEEGYRTAPSAGALYPIELLIATADGVGHYRPRKHQIEWRTRQDRRSTLQRHALDQTSVGAAPACFIIVANIDRSAAKYGQRAERYCMLEAGNVCQNLLLQATALGLVGVPIGAFDDANIAGDLDLRDRQRPFYLVPIGHSDE